MVPLLPSPDFISEDQIEMAPAPRPAAHNLMGVNGYINGSEGP